jgi:hypothetical protein
VQRRALADPVLGADRGRSPRLGDVDGDALVGDGDVDRLAELVGERLARRLPQLGEVHAPGRRAREPDDPEPDGVLAPFPELLDEPPRLQDAHESGRRGLVHTQLTSDFGDTRFAVRQHLQHADGSVHRLDLSHGSPICVRVAHGATVTSG